MGLIIFARSEKFFDFTQSPIEWNRQSVGINIAVIDQQSIHPEVLSFGIAAT